MKKLIPAIANPIPRICTFVFLPFVLLSCSPKVAPYENGPVMSNKDIKATFGPILQFMDYKPGMSVADVGAGSGGLTVMMATLMDKSVIYVQDIDTAVLQQGNLEKAIDFFAKQSEQDLRTKNEFHLVIGNVKRSNLPDGSLDLIYSNATVHNFVMIDSTMVDLGRKLKPNGVAYFRDSFKNDHKEGEFCSDPKCGRRLLTIDEFLTVMKRNGFTLVKQTPDLSGYPVFGFTVAK